MDKSLLGDDLDTTEFDHSEPMDNINPSLTAKDADNDVYLIQLHSSIQSPISYPGNHLKAYFEAFFEGFSYDSYSFEDLETDISNEQERYQEYNMNYQVLMIKMRAMLGDNWGIVFDEDNCDFNLIASFYNMFFVSHQKFIDNHVLLTLRNIKVDPKASAHLSDHVIKDTTELNDTIRRYILSDENNVILDEMVDNNFFMNEDWSDVKTVHEAFTNLHIHVEPSVFRNRLYIIYGITEEETEE